MNRRSTLTRPFTTKSTMASTVGAFLERYFPAARTYEQRSASVNQLTAEERWLKKYYFARVAFSALWVETLLTNGLTYAPVSAVLLVVYPLWDAGANLVDAQRSGGLAHNNSQVINFLVSLAATGLAVPAVAMGTHWVFGVYGAWAIVTGILQLRSAGRRLETVRAQWIQMASGAQSSLAGIFFILQAIGSMELSVKYIAGYAAFGAFYFLFSAMYLTVEEL
ncbi:hypothetical protein GGR50DRAFT_690319 [Xylaria sp. CBS 124048]|nr:hypothetical protein GGR50DRAFT_690319 [Xylaria sp. CBS 124048]